MILIVESGATKTDWCLVGPEGVAKRLQTPGMNLSTISAESNAEVFSKAVETFSGVEEVHFYAAGLLEFPTELDRVFRERFPHASFEYASDLLAAARAACGHREGIAAILGTGSNTCHYDGERIVRNIHGGGFIIGDEGSAAALGRMFLSDLVKDLVPEEIVQAFAASHETDYAALVRNVYKSPAPSRYLGSLAPFLLEHRENKYVERVFYGIRPASVGMIGAACIAVMRLCLVDTAAYAAGGGIAALVNWRALALFAAVWILTNLVKRTKKLHPIVLIAASAVIGIRTAAFSWLR